MQALEAHIETTTNWDDFRYIDSNRGISRAHVDKLKTAIKQRNALHLHPIVVTNKLEIIDGQHRLQAAKELGLPIYYVVDDDSDDAEALMAQLNSTHLNWSVGDYVKHWAIRGNVVCKKIITLSRETKWNIAICMRWMFGGSGHANELIRSGRVKEAHYAPTCDMIPDVMDICDSLTDPGQKGITGKLKFHMALQPYMVTMQERGLIEHALESFSKYGYLFKKRGNVRDNAEQIVYVHNFKRKGNRIRVIESHGRVQYLEADEIV